MSKDAMLPCFVCGTVLRNAFENGDVNQPSEGTEFRTYGHYGSTFWDSFNGEELVLNICDECLKKNAERLGRQKRFRKLVVWDTRGPIPARTVVGRQWITRELVPYFDGPEDEGDEIGVEIEEIGTLTGYSHIEWAENWRDTKANLMTQLRIEEGTDSDCKHVRFVAECLDCGASPLEGLR